jgi:hypothetical protein
MTTYSDSVDINSDNIYELKIQSMYGIDNIYYFAQGLHGTQISGTNTFGTPFTSYGWASMPQTPIGSYWAGWLPNSGFRYIGLKKVNAPNDTTFGWVKINFVGNQPGPQDTIKILEFAYNATPNTAITAGQLLINTVSEKSLLNGISIYPNVVIDNINIDNKNLKNCTYKIYSTIGQFISVGNIEKESKTNINLTKLNSGLYFISVEVENEKKEFKIIKQ